MPILTSEAVRRYWALHLGLPRALRKDSAIISMRGCKGQLSSLFPVPQMQISYVKGDATAPLGNGPKVIVHVCNDIGAWGKGFVLAISKRWPKPEQSYREWHKRGAGVPFELGQAQFVEVVPSLWVANLIGQHGIRSVGGVPPIRYQAVRDGLRRVAAFAQGKAASIHMPASAAVWRAALGMKWGGWFKRNWPTRTSKCMSTIFSEDSLRFLTSAALAIKTERTTCDLSLCFLLLRPPWSPSWPFSY